MLIDSILSGLLIFTLRMTDISLYTLRIMMVVRGRKGLAWIFAVFQSFTYVFSITVVLRDLNNPIKIIGYAAGFATGLIVGMTLEKRLAIGLTHFRIISTGRGEELCDQLRADGYGVTEVAGRGKDGTVMVLHLDVLRRDERRLIQQVTEIDEEAFITAETVRSARRGHWVPK